MVTTTALKSGPALDYGLEAAPPIGPARTGPGESRHWVPTNLDDDASWVRRIREGDQDAARALVQRLYPTILRSVRCHLPKLSSEEDLAQAVFAKIFNKLDQFSGLVPLE